MTAPRIAPTDLDFVLRETAGLWPEARGARFFITGGTGFFGCWLLETLVHANRTLGLGMTATVLTRDPGRFARKAPHLAGAEGVDLTAGRMEDMSGVAGRFDFALHAATETNPDRPGSGLDFSRLKGGRPDPDRVDPRDLVERDIAGTEQFLGVVRRSGVRKLLFTSSGAVYGPQPAGLPLVAEDSGLAPDPVDPRSANGEAKRVSELLCTLEGGAEAKIARCFSFVGPHLPLDANYAVGNFIRDAVAGGPLRIAGDGTPVRSYLYGADLAVWLWTVLFRGAHGRAYNVGSEEGISILGLAELVRATVAPVAEITVAKAAIPWSRPSRFLPSTLRARSELGLRVGTGLAEAIRRTAEWSRAAAAHIPQFSTS